MRNPSAFLLLVSLAVSPILSAQPIPVQQQQGSMHAFLLVKASDGKTIAAGDIVQVAEHARLRSRLTLRFRDDSLDEESTVYSSDGALRLISDRHVQKGPSFPSPLDLTIDVPASQVTWRETRAGKSEPRTQHMHLPDDLANGLVPTILANISPNAAETIVSYLANDPKPRLVKLSIKPESQDNFTVGGVAYPATRYVIHVELGGLTALLAPLLGKQPPDLQEWVAAGEVPSVAKMRGALYLGGPIWTIQLASPVWPAGADSR